MSLDVNDLRLTDYDGLPPIFRALDDMEADMVRNVSVYRNAVRVNALSTREARDAAGGSVQALNLLLMNLEAPAQRDAMGSAAAKRVRWLRASVTCETLRIEHIYQLEGAR